MGLRRGKVSNGLRMYYTINGERFDNYKDIAKRFGIKEAAARYIIRVRRMKDGTVVRTHTTLPENDHE